MQYSVTSQNRPYMIRTALWYWEWELYLTPWQTLRKKYRENIFPCGFQGNAVSPLSTVRRESWYRGWTLRRLLSISCLGLKSERRCDLIQTPTVALWGFIMKTVETNFTLCFNRPWFSWGGTGLALLYFISHFMSHWSVWADTYCIFRLFLCTCVCACVCFTVHATVMPWFIPVSFPACVC